MVASTSVKISVGVSAVYVNGVRVDVPSYRVEQYDIITVRKQSVETLPFQLARETFGDYLTLRLAQPHFANARSVRNALDRMRLRQASRLFADRERELTRDDLCTLQAADIRASRVFGGS